LASTLTTGTVPAVAGMREAARKRWRNWRRRKPMSPFGGRVTALLYTRCAPIPGAGSRGRPSRQNLAERRCSLCRARVQGKRDQPDELAVTLRNLHAQYVVFQTRYHDDLAAVKALEEALGSDKFSEVERIPMTANYGKGYMADLVIYRMKEEVPRGRVAPAMQIKLLGRSL